MPEDIYFPLCSFLTVLSLLSFRVFLPSGFLKASSGIPAFCATVPIFALPLVLAILIPPFLRWRHYTTQLQTGCQQALCRTLVLRGRDGIGRATMRITAVGQQPGRSDEFGLQPSSWGWKGSLKWPAQDVTERGITRQLAHTQPSVGQFRHRAARARGAGAVASMGIGSRPTTRGGVEILQPA
jgi:hypothetical protein